MEFFDGFSGSEDPWLPVEDLNSVKEALKTINNINSLPYDEFQAMINVCDLAEIEARGFFYTRIGGGKNGIVLSHLDRALCYPSFLNAWPRVSCVTLSKFCYL